MNDINKNLVKTYLVGGAVRDGLLELPVVDRDWVVVGSSPAKMLANGFQQVGKDFPVFLNPKTKEEYALARMERKSGQGYHGFEMSYDSSITLEEDLIRRDLTINAMAQDEKGLIIDPYGGLADLKNRQLRHVSASFAEDPLRVLRAARLAAKLEPFGFKVAEETKRLMQNMSASGELQLLTPERVWQELVKALSTTKPSIFFEVLREVRALKILFPELDCLYEVTQPVEHHPEGSVGIHTMMVLDAAAKLTTDIDVRFATLMHDLGKGVTPKNLWPKHHGHEQAGVPLVDKLSKRYRIPKKTSLLAEKVTQWHGIIHQGLDSSGQPYLKPKTYLKVLLSCKAFKDIEFFDKVLTACEADSKGRLGFENKPYPQRQFWLALAKIAHQVNNHKIISQGFRGKDISVEITKERMHLVRKFIAGFR